MLAQTLTAVSRETDDAGPSVGSGETGGYGLDKYGPEGLLVSSAERGWSSLSAALFHHGSGVIAWKNAQPHTEICVNVRGNQSSVITRQGGGVFDRTVAERGKIWLSPPGLEEDILDISDPVSGILHIYLPSSHFAPEGLGIDVSRSVTGSLRFESAFQDPLLAEIAFAIASELQCETSAGRLLADSLASGLAARLVQNRISRSPAQASSLMSQEGLDRRRLSRVLDYIEANLEGDLTLDHLASIACLSRFHFARAFKAAVGQPPHRYVSSKRLERAKALLARGDRPLIDIALALNFSSQTNFSRAFRQVTGRTPGDFRRNSF
jgi:AraC family transcriptional regulator